MKEFVMSKEAIDDLMTRCPAGRISTIGTGGYPYTVSVHYYYDGANVYFHGLPQGEKLRNIQADPKVCFEVSELKSVTDPRKGEDVCTADAEYESVVIRGKAGILADSDEKEDILRKIVSKYFPHLTEDAMPAARIRGTAVVKVSIETITGKYHA